MIQAECQKKEFFIARIVLSVLEAACAFLFLVGEPKRRHSVKIFLFCLMPNQFHSIVEPVHERFVSQFVQWLLTSVDGLQSTLRAHVR